MALLAFQLLLGLWRLLALEQARQRLGDFEILQERPLALAHKVLLLS